MSGRLDIRLSPLPLGMETEVVNFESTISRANLEAGTEAGLGNKCQ